MSSHIHDHRILILDFGSQYTQLIARRVREAGVYCELRNPDISEAEIREFAPKGIILSGGPDSTIGEAAPAAPHCVFEMNLPVLGICYGMQTMATQLGGKVESSSHREFGYAKIRAHGHSAFLKDIEDHTT
ncbi:glutamine amidotransferase-related protein, partial [Methylophaga sp. UBA2689]